MNYTVFQIDHTSQHFEKVISLGEKNRKTLGFFPRGAYEQHASKKQIIVAIDNDTDEILGYLLYGLSRRKMLASIVHMCVNENHRGKGITRLLFSKLKELTEVGYRAIRVHCRTDYEADKLWPKLGFQAIKEIPGRSKDGKTTLRLWMFNHGHPTLFSYIEDQTSKTKVAIDANVFFQLQHPQEYGHEESTTLLEPWLDIELYRTPEIFNEIARNPNKTKREAARKFAHSFPESQSPNDRYDIVRERIFSLLPAPKNTSDESDRRQLAHTIAAEIPFFITRDGFLLDQQDKIYETFGTSVIRPSDLILQQDELLRQAEYYPSRLAGSQIKIEKVHTQRTDELVANFLANQEETKGKFNHKLQSLLSNPHTYETSIIKDSGEPLSLISQKREYKKTFIPLLRAKKKSISKIMLRYIVNKVILDSFEDEIHITRITDKYLPETAKDTLDEYGFKNISGTWIKISIHKTLSKKELHKILQREMWEQDTAQIVQPLIDILNSDLSTATILDIEKILWPLKIIDADISTFIVAIQPDWAMHLFDDTIAQQNLFGSNPALMFNTENVYYRAAKPKLPSSPSRVLWYVSKGRGKYQNVMQIKACSYVNEVQIGIPKELFSQYKKLGIYSWDQVFSIAKKDVNKNIMAFLFSKTEVFTYPIDNSTLQSIWARDNKKFNIFSPIKITKERFFELYNLGKERNAKNDI